MIGGAQAPSPALFLFRQFQTDPEKGLEILPISSIHAKPAVLVARTTHIPLRVQLLFNLKRPGGYCFPVRELITVSLQDEVARVGLEHEHAWSHAKGAKGNAAWRLTVGQFSSGPPFAEPSLALPRSPFLDRVTKKL